MIPMLMGLLYTWDDKASVNSSRSFSKFVSLEASQTNHEAQRSTSKLPSRFTHPVCHAGSVSNKPGNTRFITGNRLKNYPHKFTHPVCHAGSGSNKEERRAAGVTTGKTETK